MSMSIVALTFLIALPSMACKINGKSDHLIHLSVGDYGGDGHDQTENHNYCTNLNKKEMKTAYKKAVKIIGYDFSQNAAVEYGENTLPLVELKKIRKSGFNLELDQNDKNAYVDSEQFALIWMHYVSIGDKDFKYIEMKGQTIDIGGYGLFD